MFTNDLKKGARIQLANGWYATLMDNAKGNTRIADVEGIERECGSVYSHDIVLAKVLVTSPEASGYQWQTVEHTPKQQALKKQVNDFFGE